MVDILHDVQALEHSIAHFLSTLVNLEQLDAVSAEDKFSLLVTHTLAHTSMIQLHRSFASDDVVSFEKCARAARSCIIIIKQLADQDFAFLDPIIGVSFVYLSKFFFDFSSWKPCWSIVGDFLIQEMDSIESTWPFMSTDDVRNDLGTVFYALTCLSPRFPLVGKYEVIANSYLTHRIAQLRTYLDSENA